MDTRIDEPSNISLTHQPGDTILESHLTVIPTVLQMILLVVIGLLGLSIRAIVYIRTRYEVMEDSAPKP